MPVPSSTSSGAIYLDKGARLAELRAAAARAAKRMPEIERVVLFGSLVHGIPTPRSDADLLVVVGSSPEASSRDRAPALLGALSPLPCPVDLLILTRAEVVAAVAEGSPLLREALEHGVDLLAEGSTSA
jgi:predicted nucleotidyltransferase